jgi:hypothetical protein
MPSIFKLSLSFFKIVLAQGIDFLRNLCFLFFDYSVENLVCYFSMLGREPWLSTTLSILLYPFIVLAILWGRTGNRFTIVGSTIIYCSIVTAYYCAAGLETSSNSFSITCWLVDDDGILINSLSYLSFFCF